MSKDSRAVIRLVYTRIYNAYTFHKHKHASILQMGIRDRRTYIRSYWFLWFHSDFKSNLICDQNIDSCLISHRIIFSVFLSRFCPLGGWHEAKLYRMSIVGVRLDIFSLFFFIRIICLSREWCGRYNMRSFTLMVGDLMMVLWGYACLQAIYSKCPCAKFMAIDSDKVLTSKLETITNHMVYSIWYRLLESSWWRVKLILNSTCIIVFSISVMLPEIYI